MGKACVILALLASSVVIGTADAASARASSDAGAKSDKGGFATSSASATSTGGVATASAFASAEIYSEMTNLIIRAFQRVDVDSSGKTCVELVVASEVEVRAEAAAIASIYASAFGEIAVEGRGEACADAEASGEAEAKAFALAVARAIVEQRFESVDGDQSAEALADALAQVVAAGSAKAFADAVISGCTTDGFGIAAQESFAEAIVRPIAEAFARAVGGPACPRRAESKVDAAGDSSVREATTAETNSFTEASRTAEVNAAGNAGAETAQITDEEEIQDLVVDALPRCRGTHSPCCRIRSKRSGICDCTRSSIRRFSSPQCDMVTYASDPVHVWEDQQTGYQCKC